MQQVASSPSKTTWGAFVMARDMKVLNTHSDFTNHIEVLMTIPIDDVADCLCGAFEGGSGYWINEIKYELPTGFTRISYTDWREREDLKDYRNPTEGSIESQHIAKTWCYPYELPFLGGTIKVFEDGDEYNPKVLDMQSIRDGVITMAAKSQYHFKDLVEGSGDAITSDVLLQYCLFGEIIYG